MTKNINYELMSDLELKRSSEDVLSEMTRRQILKHHNIAISYNQKNDFYYTYMYVVENGEKKRKMIKRNSRADLENYLIRYYEVAIGNKTFKAYYDEWIYQLQRSDATIVNYVNHYKRAFAGSDFEKMRMQQIDIQTIRSYLYKIAPNYTEKTISNVFTILRSVFDYAANEDPSIMIYDIPKFKNLPYKAKERKMKKRVLTKNEAKRVIEYLDNKKEKSMHDLGILFLFFSGVRVGELATIKISDIESDRIHIQQSETRRYDKDTKKQTMAVGDCTKTLSSNRYIGITNRIQEILNAALCYNHKTEFLFENFSKRIRSQGFRKHFKVTLRQCGITDEVSIHSTRRFFASYLHREGVSDEVIRKILGHSDIATTQRCYICDIDDDIEEQIDVLNLINL